MSTSRKMEVCFCPLFHSHRNAARECGNIKSRCTAVEAREVNAEGGDDHPPAQSESQSRI